MARFDANVQDHQLRLSPQMGTEILPLIPQGRTMIPPLLTKRDHGQSRNPAPGCKGTQGRTK